MDCLDGGLPAIKTIEITSGENFLILPSLYRTRLQLSSSFLAILPLFPLFLPIRATWLGPTFHFVDRCPPLLAAFTVYPLSD